jgi:hypothetical protein
MTSASRYLSSARYQKLAGELGDTVANLIDKAVRKERAACARRPLREARKYRARESRALNKGDADAAKSNAAIALLLENIAGEILKET